MVDDMEGEWWMIWRGSGEGVEGEWWMIWRESGG